MTSERMSATRTDLRYDLSMPARRMAWRLAQIPDGSAKTTAVMQSGEAEHGFGKRKKTSRTDLTA